jgi:hypothetical protein
MRRAIKSGVFSSAVALAIIAIPNIGQAVSLYLNDQLINGAKNQEFLGCDVKIDAKGDIYIYAKGFAVKKEGEDTWDTQAVASPGAPPTKRYFLVTEKAAPSMSQYDIDLYINNKWVRKLLDDEAHIYLELTQYLVQGQNAVRFIARKNIKDGGERRSQSANHFFRVVIGAGDMGGRNVMLTKKLIDFRVTAAQTDTVTQKIDMKVF